MTVVANWPPFSWRALAFLGGLFLMLNHFFDQGIKYPGSEALLRFLAIWVSPALFLVAGILAMSHGRRVGTDHRFGAGHLVVSSVIWCALALVPLVLLESTLFPVGHGVPQGVAIAVAHLPFVGVFLAGLWNVGRMYRRSPRTLVAIISPAPAGFGYGMALVYSCVLGARLGRLWFRCRDAESLSQFLTCFF